MASIHFLKKLIHRATIERATESRSASGEVILTWAVRSDVTRRYVEKQEAIAQEGIGFMMGRRHLLLTDEGEDLQEDDRIKDIVLIADGLSVNSGPFRIEAKYLRNTFAGHHLSCNLERVEGET